MFGFQCKLYLKIDDVWTEVTASKDLSLALESDNEDVAERGDEGWKNEQPSILGWGVTGDATWNAAAEWFTTLKTAFFNRTAVDARALDSDGYGVEGEAWVNDLGRPEGRGQHVTVAIDLGGKGKPEWVTPGS